MKKSHFYYSKLWYILISFGGVFLPISCMIDKGSFLHDEKDIQSSFTTRSFSEPEIPNEYFFYSDSRFNPIIQVLQNFEEELNFMDSFTQEYGIPLWNYADIIEGEEQTCYYVPLFHADAPLTINSIWFFYIENEMLSYIPIKRNDDYIIEHGQQFIFDKMSYQVFGDANSSGLIFEEAPQSRVWITVRECWKIVTSTEALGEIHSYWDCRDSHIWVDLVKFENNPLNTGSAGGGGGGVGGGSQGSEITLPPSSKAEKIFNTEDNEGIKKILDFLLDEILDDCMGSNLYNSLRNQLGSNKIKISFVDGSEMFPSYNLDDHTLSLHISYLESNILFHEMWHVYQASKESKASFKSAMLNREIEAHFAQYLYLRKRPEWIMKYSRIYNQNQRASSILNIDEYINEKGIPLDSDSELCLEGHLIGKVVPIFRNSGYAKYPFNSDDDAISNFSNLNTITKNCY